MEISNTVEVLESVLFTILGGAISGLVGYFLYRLRLKDEVRMKHFEAIKESCLKPIRDQLEELISKFELREGQLDPCMAAGQDWWSHFSFRKWVKDRVLYDDLPNHFPGLAERLREIEAEVVRRQYPRFLELLCELSKSATLMARNYIGVSEGEVDLASAEKIGYFSQAILMIALECGRVLAQPVHAY